MTPERWKEIEEVFESVMERPPSERSGFLAEACAGDDSLRHQVETLISSHERAGTFIESPAVGRILPFSLETEAPLAMIGRRIGAYKIVREIGRGGMGAVYLAVRADDEFQKRVAIKLIKRGMDTDYIIRRFRNERQILAGLDHPHVARLLDGGTTEDGLPYFVMEYVEGQPIHYYCDTQRLSTTERLKLFLKVCSAVQYAHQNLVIHRDLKPTNILVTTDGTPKLLDFGIAKLLNPEMGSQTLDPTTAASRLMTPEYASPEQVRGGSATIASDVYSLGVMLYELITGHRPYRLRSRLPEEMAQVICEEEPERPSIVINMIEVIEVEGGMPVEITPDSISKTREGTLERLRRQIAGNLDSIILKALRKEPHHRYQTVEQFADDIQRYIDGLPISAPSYFTAAVRADFELSEAPTGGRSIAVLPFKMLHSEEKSDEYLGMGMADAVITKLSNIKRITVRPTSSVIKYIDGEYNLMTAGQELDVNYVLDGRIQRVGDRIRVTIQLIKVRDGATLWAATFNEKFTDIFEVEDSISAQVAQALVPRISGEELEQLHKRETENAEAYQSYLRGRFNWNQFTDESLTKALAFFDEAIRLDPEYALAHVGVADYYNWAAIYSVLPPHEAYPKARAAATRALEIDDQLAEAHAALAFTTMCYDWEWEEAERRFQRAIELGQHYPEAHQWYSNLLASQGRFTEALPEIKRAQELNPLAPMDTAMVAWTCYQLRRYEEALKEVERALEIEPNFGVANGIRAMVFERMGKKEEAIEEARISVSKMGRDALLPRWVLGHVLGSAGRTKEAQEVLDDLLQLSMRRYVAPYYLAIICAGMNDRARAFTYLDKSAENRDAWLLWLSTEPKFDDLRSDPRFTNLLYRVGHRETKAKSILEAETKPQKVDTAEGVSLTAETREHPARSRKWTWMLAAASLVLAVILSAAFYFKNQQSTQRQSNAVADSSHHDTQRTLASSGAHTLAVLPFRTLGAEGDNQYLGIGLADALITKLGQVKQLSVRPSSSVQPYADQATDPQAAGRQLGVECVLTGEVQQIGERVLVTTKLINVADSSVLWFEKFDQKFTDISTVQDSISDRVVRSMTVSVTSEEQNQLAKHYTENSEAYQLYLIGRYHAGKRTPEGLKQAIKYFEDAVKKDENYALAYAGLADAYSLLALYDTASPKESFQKSKDAATRALQIDGQLAEAHTSLAFVKLYYDRDFAGAEEEFKSAIGLKPNYSTAHHWYALNLSAMGRHDEAIAEIKRAQVLDPLSLIINTAVGNIYYYARQYDRAIEQCLKTIEMDQKFAPAHTILRQAYERKGMYTEAMNEYQKERTLLGDSLALRARLAHVNASSSKNAEALKIANEMIARRNQPGFSSYELAQIFALTDEDEQALKWLDTASEEHSIRFAFIKVDPDFDRLRSHPGFSDLLHRAGLNP